MHSGARPPNSGERAPHPFGLGSMAFQEEVVSALPLKRGKESVERVSLSRKRAGKRAAGACYLAYVLGWPKPGLSVEADEVGSRVAAADSSLNHRQKAPVAIIEQNLDKEPGRGIEDAILVGRGEDELVILKESKRLLRPCRKGVWLDDVLSHYRVLTPIQ